MDIYINDVSANSICFANIDVQKSFVLQVPLGTMKYGNRTFLDIYTWQRGEQTDFNE